MTQVITLCVAIAALFFGTKVALSTSLLLHRGFSVSGAGGICLSGHVGVTSQRGCSARSEADGQK